MRPICLVVPCYNEAARFDAEGMAALAKLVNQRGDESSPRGTARGGEDVTLLFVNDGSTDETPACLRSFCDRADVEAELLSYDRNRGKAEAVRCGMRHALAAGTGIVGYVDADLATPPEEVQRLLSALERGGYSVVLGSRVQLLGYSIERSAFRHYVGRVFGTLASMILGVRVYDTQCGAKFFRQSAALDRALAEPYVSRWSFDVELLGRLLIDAPGAPGVSVGEVREVPLKRWRDVPGSKLSLRDSHRVAWELTRVALDLARRRRLARQEAPESVGRS
jgi:glycosyltransferase involved in cell wall biosynthesis